MNHSESHAGVSMYGEEAYSTASYTAVYAVCDDKGPRTIPGDSLLQEKLSNTE